MIFLLLDDVGAHPSGIKLILMSATLDAASFSRYFGGAPLVEIPSAPRFPVEEIYLEEMARFLEGRALGPLDGYS